MLEKVLSKLGASQTPGIRRAVINILAANKPRDAKVISILSALASDIDPNIKEAAEKALKELKQ
ncbi:hypothetical protein D3C72_2235250 [compost metagenome]